MHRSTFAVAVVLAAVLGMLPALGPVRPQPVRAASTFTFYGSGFGHGIGMSQWGAYGLAQMGWGHGRILTHFYRGTAVERLDTLPAAIRIGLTTGRRAVHLTAQGGPVRIWEGRPERGVLIGEIPAGETWVVASKDRDYAVRDASDRLVGGRWGSPDQHIFVTYADVGSRVFVPEADQIWGKGFSYGRGSLEFNLTSCGGPGCTERLIARVGLEEYLYGLGEVPTTWPVETLRAQAVAARSYAAYSMKHVGLRADCNCHLTDGAGDQVYMGASRELSQDGARWVRAVDDTRSKVVTYGGAVIQAFYAASDGGHSENVEDVWHGGNDAYAIPWLRGVCDPGESTAANPWDEWSRSFDATSLTSRLAPYTGTIGAVTSFVQIRRGRSGRIISAVVRGSSGSDAVTGIQLKAALGLPDDRVWINSNRTIVGPLRETYDALGCAPGLPSSPVTAVSGGAQQLFEDGGLYRNGDIGLTLWLRGALDREYRAVGAAAGRLGVPLGNVRTNGSVAPGTTLVCGTCRRVDLVGGRIYFRSGVGAHALWGRVLETFLSHGGTDGALGFPETRVLRLRTGGTRARFEAGSIRCPKGVACLVTVG